MEVFPEDGGLFLDEAVDVVLGPVLVVGDLKDARQAQQSLLRVPVADHLQGHTDAHTHGETTHTHTRLTQLIM